MKKMKKLIRNLGQICLFSTLINSLLNNVVFGTVSVVWEQFFFDSNLLRDEQNFKKRNVQKRGAEFTKREGEGQILQLTISCK